MPVSEPNHADRLKPKHVSSKPVAVNGKNKIARMSELIRAA